MSRQWSSQSHVRWDCVYHIVIVPKSRRKVFYGRKRDQVGLILQVVCVCQKGIELD